MCVQCACSAVVQCACSAGVQYACSACAVRVQCACSARAVRVQCVCSVRAVRVQCAICPRTSSYVLCSASSPPHETGMHAPVGGRRRAIRMRARRRAASSGPPGASELKVGCASGWVGAPWALRDVGAGERAAAVTMGGGRRLRPAAARNTAVSALKTQSSPAEEPATRNLLPPCMPTEWYLRCSPDEGIAILLAATEYWLG